MTKNQILAYLKRKGTRRAIALTEEKYCSTFATLRQAVRLTSDFEILPSEC